jgi:adenylate cyclase
MRSRRLLPTVLGLLLVLALVALRIADPYPLQVARDVAFDTFQRIKPRTGPEGPVRVVDIDEASLKTIGQWPWPRSKLATLTDRLTQLGAAAIGYDILFPEPDRMSPNALAALVPGADVSKFPDNDALFATSLGRSRAALGFSEAAAGLPMSGTAKSGFAISGSDPTQSLPPLSGAVTPLQSLRDAAPGLGSLSLETQESASAVRRLPLLWAAGKQLYPSLSIELLRLATGTDTIVALGDTSDSHTMDGLRVGPLTVPTTAQGDLWLYYRAPDPSLYVSAADLLGDSWQTLAPKIQGEIVLIGTSASGLLDLHQTALGNIVPGVSVHAQAIEQIFLGNNNVPGQFLSRADWVQGLELVAFALAGLMLVLVVLRLGPLAGLVVGAGLVAVIAGGAWALFANYGMLVDPSFPAVGATLVYGAMVYFQFSISDRGRREVRRAFGYYVAPELLSEIERNAGKLELGGELKELTVMFSDMRGFTSYTEKHTPHETVATLNTLFGALGKQIMDRFGTIDKFIGDAIMAFWNAPVVVPNHPHKAALSAIAMRETLEELNARNAFGDYQLAIGIGLATGVALVGNMGLETRFDYSIIGDPVNTASRVESECKAVGFDIVAAESTALATPELAWLEAGSVHLKGKAHRLKVFVLVGDEEFAMTGKFITLSAAHRALVEALRHGEGGEELSTCRSLAPSVHPKLEHFYELIPGRIPDFVSRA